MEEDSKPKVSTEDQRAQDKMREECNDYTNLVIDQIKLVNTELRLAKIVLL